MKCMGRVLKCQFKEGRRLEEVRPGILYFIKLLNDPDEKSSAELSGLVFENHCHEPGWHHLAKGFLPVAVTCKSNECRVL